MTKAFRLQRPSVPLSRPCRVRFLFILPRPESRAKEFYHTSKPDLSKLIRAVEDSMTDAEVICDDSILCSVMEGTMKRYADIHESPGVSVFVQEIEVESP